MVNIVIASICISNFYLISNYNKINKKSTSLHYVLLVEIIVLNIDQ